MTLSLFALLLVVASLRLSYSTVQARLVDLYGVQRASRYFTPAVFASAMSRIRLGAGVLIAVALGIVGFRDWLVRSLDPIWGALVLGVRHARRSRIEWNLPRASALAVITLIALFVRLRFIGQPIRYDEADTILSYASKPLYLGLSIYNEPNNHLFHTLLVHFAIIFAGAAEWAVRLPAAVAGVMLCPLVYALAQRLAGGMAALWTAALVGTSSVLVEYSTNARGYTLICCATLALLIAAYETLRRASPGWFALFALATVIGFWTIPIFLIPFGGALLWMAWESLSHHRYFHRVYRLRLVVSTLAAGAATILVYLPPAAVNGPNALLRNQWVAPRNFHAFLSGNLARFRETWEMWNRDLPVWWPWVMALVFLASLTLFPSLRRLIISLLVWTVFLFATRRFVPFARNWLLFLPIVLIGTAAGLASIVERVVPPVRRDLIGSVTAVILAALLVVPLLRGQSVLASTETGVLRSAPEIAAFLASDNLSPDRVFRSTTSDLPLEYYWWRRTGARPGNADLQDLRRQGIHDGWFLLNDAYGETLQSFSVRYGFESVRVLETRPFDGAYLYHVTWTP